MLYEKVFNRIFRKWTCDHDPVEYDKGVHRTSHSGGGFSYYYDYHTVYTHTTTFYKCSFCGYKTKETTTTEEKVDRNRSLWV